VSCAKTAELIDNHAVWNAESGGSRERVLHGDVDAAQEGTLGVSGRLKSIVKHRILGIR